MDREVQQRIFDFFRRHQAHYRMTFSLANPAAQSVLADLQEFCHANMTTATSNDPIQMAIREGRRQVWLRITRGLNLSPEEQFNLSLKKDKP